MSVFRERLTLYGALMGLLGVALGAGAEKVGEVHGPAAPLALGAAVMVLVLAALSGGAWWIERRGR